MFLFSGFPPAYCLHGRDEGAARDNGPEGKQDWCHECEIFKIYLTLICKVGI